METKMPRICHPRPRSGIQGFLLFPVFAKRTTLDPHLSPHRFAGGLRPWLPDSPSGGGVILKE